MFAEDFFDVAFNASAEIGVSRIGILGDRISLVHLLDAFADVTYTVFVKPEDVELDNTGTFGFFAKLMSSMVWMCIAAVFILSVAFLALYHSISSGSRITRGFILNEIFCMLAASVSQGEYKPRQNSRRNE